MTNYNDPATQYAKDILANQYAACKHIKAAAKRHLNDLHRKDIIWDPNEANDVVSFFKHCCYVSNPELQKNVPLELLPWQEFLIYQLFGWRVGFKDKDKRIPGSRRFRKLFLTTAKSAGKSALFAALCLYLTTRDNYYHLKEKKRIWIDKPYCVVSASTQAQAVKVGLGVASEMVTKCKDFEEKAGCVVLGGNSPYAIISTASGGRLEAISNRHAGTGVGGLILHAIHMEETSEDDDRERWDNLTAGLKLSPQPLITIATNPAPQTAGIAFEEYQAAISAANGEGPDDLLGLVYTADEKEIPKSVVLNDRWAPSQRVWEKSNPSLRYGLPPKSYIISRVNNAKTARQRREVLRLNFGSWMNYQSGFLSKEHLINAEVDTFDLEQFKGSHCILGLDLANRQDFTALSYLITDNEDKHWLKVRAFTGLSTIPERAAESSGDLISWMEEGWIEGSENAILDYGIIAEAIAEAAELFQIDGIAMDPNGLSIFEQSLETHGIDYTIEGDKDWEKGSGIVFVRHAQGQFPNRQNRLTMDTSISALEGMVVGNDDGPLIRIERNPVFEWGNECCIVKEDMLNKRRLSKRDAANTSRGKIDVVIAAVMAAGLLERGKEDLNPSQAAAMWENDSSFSWSRLTSK